MFVLNDEVGNGIQVCFDLSTTAISSLKSLWLLRTSHLTVALLILSFLRDGATCAIWVRKRVGRVPGEGAHIFLHYQAAL